MQNRQHQLLLFVGLLALGAIFAVVVFVPTSGNRVLSYFEAGPEDVNINAVVPSCQFTLRVYPQKRIPATNNWATSLQVQIFNALNQSVGSYTTNSNNLGVSTVDLCAQGINVTVGTYSFYIRGDAHLRRRFANEAAFAQYSTTLDLTTGNRFLIAGETSVVYDNYINALDLSTQGESLFTTTPTINDLNKDGIVNAMDLAITISNLYLAGD